MAGYTGTPLPKKLGIKAGHKVCLLNAPNAFERRLTAQDVRIAHDLRLPPVDVVVLFVDRVADLERRFADIAARLIIQAGGFALSRALYEQANTASFLGQNTLW